MTHLTPRLAQTVLVVAFVAGSSLAAPACADVADINGYSFDRPDEDASAGAGGESGFGGGFAGFGGAAGGSVKDAGAGGKAGFGGFGGGAGFAGGAGFGGGFAGFGGAAGSGGGSIASCQQCISSKCPAQMAACGGDASCACWANCLMTHPNDFATCSGQCGTPDSTATQLMTCAQSACTAACTVASCTPPVSGPCDTFAQCGCSTGTACYVSDYTTGATSCFGAGKTAPGGNCTNSNECAPKSQCVLGVCKQFCHSAADCQAGGSCEKFSVASNQPVAGYFYCTQPCDPQSPQAPSAGFVACGPGSTCQLAFGYNDCSGPVGNIATGGTCNAWLDCQPGLVCVGIDPNYYCRQWCRVGSTFPCGNCTGFSTPEYANGIEYGFCP